MYKLQKGLPREIESLKKELEGAQTALLKVGEVPREQLDAQVRLWAREVREASYDMEDILDTFIVHVAEVAAPAKENEGLCKRLLERIAKLFHKTKERHTIAGTVEEMKKRLQEVADRRDRFAVAVAPPAPAMRVDPRLVDMHKEAAQLIGIDKTSAELISMLLPLPRGQGDAPVSGGSSRVPTAFSSINSSMVNSGGGGEGRGQEKRRRVHVGGEEEGTRPTNDVQLGPLITSVVSSDSTSKMKIVFVVGVGGLGKTTLAKAVYDQLKSQFDCWAFVSVGRKPDLRQVINSIFFELDRQEYEATRNLNSLQPLIRALREFLQNKRYAR